jgi:thiol:disulfide interchange protein/DsbC/DsbD-like thiol-disulfide interchange protein
MQLVRYIVLGLLLLAAPALQAAQTSARLILDADTAQPGQTVLAGVLLHHPPGWHTYWRNSGDSGQGTQIKWTLPAGVTAGQIQWPIPEKEIVADLTSYIYSGDVVLLVPLTIASDVKPGELDLKAAVSWLECEKMCLPGKGDVQAKLTIGSTTKPGADANLIASAQKRLPLIEPALKPKAWWGNAGDSRPLFIEWTPVKTAEGADFFPYEDNKLQISGETKILDPAAVRLQKDVKKLEGDWPAKMTGLLIEHRKGEAPVGYEVTLSIDSKPLTAVPSTLGPTHSLLAMLALAFLGGLILNIMPCVLPVISLKILSFVKQSREAPGHVRKLGLIYVLGVLVSFLVLAGIVIAIQLAGGNANWGMHFQNPKFLVAMTVLVALVSLNLFGIFEVNLGGNVMGAAGELAGKGGATGAFFNGVLATLLATPCTAPVLASALGFAFAQPPLGIALMFLAIGLGLAAPYILLSFQPNWLRFLPKPGPWMERFKTIMGFPMLATCFWLFQLTANHLGKTGAFRFGIFLVVLALTAWMWGEFIQKSATRHKGLVVCNAVLLLFAAASYAMARPQELAWQPWSAQAIAKARADGHPVLVDFTADWCATCQVNKHSLETATVQDKLKKLSAITLVGDYTRQDDAITAELKRFNRAGVPLVLVYPKNPGAEPIVLPEVLTSTIVLDALEKAGQ